MNPKHTIMRPIYSIIPIAVLTFGWVNLYVVSAGGLEPKNLDVELSDIWTEPRVIHIGDEFRIKVSIVNKGLETISFRGVCTSPLSAEFSSKVKVERGSVCDEWLEAKLEPGVSVTVEGINGEFLTAVEAGTTLANMTFTFWIDNPLASLNVTKQFVFEIYQERVEQCTINSICVTLPELLDISDHKASRIIAENQYQIQSSIRYEDDKPLEFFYAMIIKDELGRTVSLLWARGMLQPNQEINISTSWLPEAEGNYTLRTHFWTPYEYTELIDPPPGTIWIDTTVDVRSAE